MVDKCLALISNASHTISHASDCSNKWMTVHLLLFPTQIGHDRWLMIVGWRRCRSVYTDFAQFLVICCHSPISWSFHVLNLRQFLHLVHQHTFIITRCMCYFSCPFGWIYSRPDQQPNSQLKRVAIEGWWCCCWLGGLSLGLSVYHRNVCYW